MSAAAPAPGHDVFVSYSSLDKPVADAVCATLEQRGVRCWIAPRDILAGTDWGEAIIGGIEQSRIMVLVFSSNANASQQVKREVERAVNKGLTVVPFRIEDVVPERSLEYFLSSPHWLDAMSPPLERHLGFLADTVQTLLQAPGEAAVIPAPPPRRSASFPSRAPQGQRPGMVIAALAALVGVAIGGVLLVRALTGGGGDVQGQASPSGGASTSAGGDFDKQFAGHWTDSSASGGLTQALDMTIASDGAYTATRTFKETGHLTFPGSDPAGLITIDGGTARSFHWGQAGDTAGGVYELMPDGLAQYIEGSSPRALNDYLAFGAQTTWKRTQHTGSQDTWELDITFGGAPWTMTLTDTPSGAYTFNATTTDTGKIFATNGALKLVSDQQGLLQGSYQFTGSDAVAVTVGSANTVWKRAK